MKSVFSVIRTLLVIVMAALATVLMCASILILTLGNTVLNGEYIKTEMRDKDVYTGLTDEIKDSARDAYRTSNIRQPEIDSVIDSLLDAAIRPEPLRLEFEDILDQLYAGEELTLNGNYFIDDYASVITDFLTRNNIETEQKTVSGLIRTVADAVAENIDVSEYTAKVTETFNTMIVSVVVAYMLTIAAIVLLLVLIFAFAKDRLKAVSIPFFISGLIMVLAALIIKLTALQDVYIVNDSFNGFVHAVVDMILLVLALYGVKNIVVGFLLRLFRKHRIKKAQRKTALQA